MHLKFILLGFTLGLFSLTAIAGGAHEHGHGHSPVDQTTANIKASEIINNLVKQKVIDKSWVSTPVNHVEQKTFNGKKSGSLAL